jgi:hypothetical protein
MSNEFDEYSNLPDWANPLVSRETPATAPQPTNRVDPYQLMMNRKQQPDGPPPEIKPVTKWPEAEVKQLEDYCKQRGIVGFNPGLMPPLVALAMLKQQYGDYTNVPLEERVPEGYEKIGTNPKYGPNHTYSQAMREKQIIHG